MKKVLLEGSAAILTVNFLYEGIYKILNFKGFTLWLRHAPLIAPFSNVLNVLIPTIEIVIAFMLVTSFRRAAFWASIISLLLFVSWVVSAYLFTDRLFWPYHWLWTRPSWAQKMTVAIVLTWIAFISIIFLPTKPPRERRSEKSLRKLPANAQ